MMPAVDAQALSTLIYVFEIAGVMVGVLFVANMLLVAIRWRRRRRGAHHAELKRLRPAEEESTGVGPAESSDGGGSQAA